MARQKKFKFQLGPDTQYLFVTVIEIEAKQYARIEIGGLFVMLESTLGAADFEGLELDLARKGSRCEGDDRPLKLRISTSGILMV